MMRAADEGTTQSSQHRYKTADGSYIWIETLGTPLYNRKKSIVGFVCNSRDITQQKNMEDALRESEEKYRSCLLYTSRCV